MNSEVVETIAFDEVATEYKAVRLRARNADDARKWGDAFLSKEVSGVAVVSADLPDGKHTLFAFVTDDLIGQGIRADAIVREIASVVGGRGVGGRTWLRRASRIPIASTKRSEWGETWWKSSLVKLWADGLPDGLGGHSCASGPGRVEGLAEDSGWWTGGVGTPPRSGFAPSGGGRGEAWPGSGGGLSASRCRCADHVRLRSCLRSG